MSPRAHHKTTAPLVARTIAVAYHRGEFVLFQLESFGRDRVTREPPHHDLLFAGVGAEVRLHLVGVLPVVGTIRDIAPDERTGEPLVYVDVDGGPKWWVPIGEIKKVEAA